MAGSAQFACFHQLGNMYDTFDRVEVFERRISPLYGFYSSDTKKQCFFGGGEHRTKESSLGNTVFKLKNVKKNEFFKYF